jgi:NADPH-dependent curcumin reductase CurA
MGCRIRWCPVSSGNRGSWGRAERLSGRARDDGLDRSGGAQRHRPTAARRDRRSVGRGRAVGSVAGQIAKINGAGVVGIAGGGEKCALLTERLWFDVAVDHRASNWHEQLMAATPNGVDVDFENVGGEIMDAVFARLSLRARVVLRGLISAYNDADPPPGPRSFANLLIQRVLLQGFIVIDHLDRMAEAIAELSGWMRERKLRAEGPHRQQHHPGV